MSVVGLVIVVFAAAVLFAGLVTSFSRRGRGVMLRAAGIVVTKELGELSPQDFMRHQQAIRVLDCEKDGSRFVVLECELTQNTRTARSVTWLKLTPHGCSCAFSDGR